MKLFTTSYVGSLPLWFIICDYELGFDSVFRPLQVIKHGSEIYIKY